MPNNAIISSDIGNNCAIGNAYPSFQEGRKYLAPGLFGPCGYGFPAIAGAKIAQPKVPVIGFAGDGAFGISMNDLTDKLDAAIKAQMNEGKTTFIEIILNKELGEPFRRDAMKAPVSVAGISKNDMIPQQGA